MNQIINNAQIVAFFDCQDMRAQFVIPVLVSILILSINSPMSSFGTIEIIDLGTLGGTFSIGAAINEAGQVVGRSTTSSFVTHAFVWDSENGMTDLGTLGGAISSATAINEEGQVAGISGTSSGEGHAFITT